MYERDWTTCSIQHMPTILDLRINTTIGVKDCKIIIKYYLFIIYMQWEWIKISIWTPTTMSKNGCGLDLDFMSILLIVLHSLWEGCRAKSVWLKPANLKACGYHMVIFFNLCAYIVWCVVRWGSRNKVHHNSKCLEEIGPCLHVLWTTPHSTMNTTRRTSCVFN